MTNENHAAQLEKFGIKPFDLVVVNLYPFADTVRSGADEAATIEKIDIGGPSMVRGAAKNNATVAIVTDPNDYALVAARIENGEGFSLRNVAGWPVKHLLTRRLMMPLSTSGPRSIGRSQLPSISRLPKVRRK